MDIILVPGLWLDGSTWDQVVPHLEKAGHRATALTLPGMESAGADRSAVSWQDQVDAVVAALPHSAVGDGPLGRLGRGLDRVASWFNPFA